MTVLKNNLKKIKFKCPQLKDSFRLNLLHVFKNNLL